MVVEGMDLAAEPAGAPLADDWTLTLTSDLIARGPDLGSLENLDIPTLCLLAGMEEPAAGQWVVKKAVTETDRGVWLQCR